MGGLMWQWQPLNDIWRSNNGIDWDLVTENAQFSPREKHSSVVKDDLYIQVIGGIDADEEILNDVWVSTDGVNYNLLVSQADFQARKSFASVVHYDYIYIVGGAMANVIGGDLSHDENILNDVWRSKDGAQWEEINKDAQFLPRNDFRLISQNYCQLYNLNYDIINLLLPCQKYLILTAGQAAMKDKNYQYLNDIWMSQDGIDWFLLTDQAEFQKRNDHAVVTLNN